MVAAVLAQIGLSDPTGGIIVLLVGAAMAALGLSLCVIAVIGMARRGGSRRRVLLGVAGLVLTSPALWFAFVLFAPDIPQDKTWDFSSSRSTAQWQDPKAGDAYYYQGHIRSTVRLPAGKGWSGDAYLVVISTRAGEVRDIHWQGRPADTTQVFERTKPMLAGLGLPGGGLDAWYEKVRRGEPASFSATRPPSEGPDVEVMIRGTTAEDNWATHVNVRWAEGDTKSPGR